MTLAMTTAGGGALSTAQILEGIKTVKDALAPDLTDSELKLFAMVANRSGLDPFAKQIYAVKRKGRVTFQTGIDGYRSIAERTGEYLGSDEPEYGPWVDQPYGHPEWARVVVHRAGRNPQAATAYWDEYVPSEDMMWRKMPRGQLAKCAEALAFRKAFPHVFADVYTTEEMQQADSRDAAEAHAATVAAAEPRARIAARREALTAPAPEQEPPPPAPASEPAEPVTEAEAVEACPAVSPYEGSAPCARPAGHAGNHRSSDKESW